MNLPDPSVLSAALNAVYEKQQSLATLGVEKTTLETRAADYLATADATPNESANLQYASDSARLAALPGILERVQAQIKTLADTLIAEMQSFERQFADCGNAEREALLDRIEVLIKPFAPDYKGDDGQWKNQSRFIVERCSVPNSIPVAAEQLNAPTFLLASNSFGEPDQIRTAIARTEGLLSLRARVEKTGGFLPPKSAAAK